MHTKRMRLIGIILVLTLILTIPIHASAVSGTLYESENNNTYLTADISYDDYNNYGTISGPTDEDWWEITMEEGGLGAIWLGNIPTGCDYDIYLYDADGETLLASSKRTTGNQEYIRVRFYAGIPIYLKIVSASGYSSSSQYLLRFKNYEIGKTHTFGFDYADFSNRTESTIDCHTSSNNLTDHDYHSYFYANNTAFDYYLSLINAQMVIFNGHSEAGVLYLNNSSFYASTNNDMSADDYAISDFSSGSLSEIQLMIFAGCRSGNDGGSYGNLVDVALSRGVKIAIGWTDTIYEGHSAQYLEEFTYSLVGQSVKDALDNADEWVDRSIPKQRVMLSWYAGASQLEAINLC